MSLQMVVPFNSPCVTLQVVVVVVVVIVVAAAAAASAVVDVVFFHRRAHIMECPYYY